ncbi:MAG: fatty acid desaturase [Nitratireductor sp.]|nr:fatty acid desaturase [Nitratireductor sp.]
MKRIQGRGRNGGQGRGRADSVHASAIPSTEYTAAFLRFTDSGDWRTLLLMAAIYAVWAGLVFFGPPAFASMPGALLAIVLIAPMLTLHSSTQHEFVHGHPFRAQLLNDILAFAPIGLIIPYCRFKETHLTHHLDCNLCDPFDDPESWYMDISDWLRQHAVARAVLNANNTFAGRLVFGPLIGTLGLLRNDFKRVRAGEGWLAARWLFHWALAGILLASIAAFAMVPVWAYLVCCYLAMSLLMVRTFAEHQSELAEGSQDKEGAVRRGRSIIVENGGIFSWLFLNNSFHAVHHAAPSLAWYRLPERYRQNAVRYREMNRGYSVASYGELFRRYAFRRKEPVPFPGNVAGKAGDCSNGG